QTHTLTHTHTHAHTRTRTRTRTRHTHRHTHTRTHRDICKFESISGCPGAVCLKLPHNHFTGASEQETKKQICLVTSGRKKNNILQQTHTHTTQPQTHT